MSESALVVRFSLDAVKFVAAIDKCLAALPDFPDEDGRRVNEWVSHE